MNEELASRLRRQEFQRMMAKKFGYAQNTIDPDKDKVVDPKIRKENENKEKKS